MGAAKREILLRYAIGISNLVKCIMCLIPFALGVFYYKKQRDDLGEYMDPGANPPVIVISLSILVFLIGISFGFYVTYKLNFKYARVNFYLLTIQFVGTFIFAFLVMFHFGTASEIEVFDSNFQAGILNYDNDPVVTGFMDRAQRDLHCCGVNSYMDWQQSRPFECNGGAYSNNCSVPISCCIPKPGGAIPEHCGSNATLPDHADSEKIYTKGCVEVVQDHVFMNALTVGSTLHVVAVALLIETVVTGIYVYGKKLQFPTS